MNIELCFAAYDLYVFPENDCQTIPVHIHKINRDHPGRKRRNRLAKFQPKIPKNLTDEASSQHTG
jgi:hypothetical protein